MQFNVVIERDEDGRYVAECLDLPGCLSEGETLGEALENISEATFLSSKRSGPIQPDE